MRYSRTIVEVGANYGQHTCKFVNEADTFVWSFEPLPILSNRLKEIYKDQENLTVIQKAVSDYNGVSQFHVSDPSGGAADYGCSSLNQFTDNIQDIWVNRPDFAFVDTIDVEVIRMDKFIEDNNITQIDYFHCDAQGSDLSVLKSFGDKLNVIVSGVVEGAHRINLYSVDNTVTSIVDFLESNGFRVTNKNDQNSSSEELDVYFERI
jgi:FkbM family methyltransferase